MINEEYLSYVDYLKSINFEQKLEILKEKYADKKIILFGIGVFLDVVLDNYDLKKYIDVVGISDKRITEDKTSAYLDCYNLYNPMSLRALDFDIILDTGVLFENPKTYLRKNYYIKKSIPVEKLVQISFSEHFANCIEKWIAVLKYLVTSKNLFKAVKYSFLCQTREIIAKTNYIKNLNRIKKSDKPIRTAFICSDVTQTDFVGLYNLIYFDKNFKLFPIILTPQNLVENEEIDEEKMNESVKIFNSFEFKVIDGIDRQTKELACLHAFKPDLIFYQKPIYIKDDFSPLKMSEHALTFTIDYLIKNSDYTAMGSKYFRKQVSDLWKVFLFNNEDKNLYSEYADTKYKDVTTVINIASNKTNNNSEILKYLRKCFSLN